MHSKVKISCLIFLSVISLSSLLFAGAPDTLWTRTYGGIGTEVGYSVFQASDGGFIIAGYISDLSSTDAYLIRTDFNGDTLWTKRYGGIDPVIGWSIQQTNDNGFIITGYIHFPENQDVYLIRTDSNGDTLWTKTYGGTNWEEGRSVQQTNDGGFIITGNTDPLTAEKADVYLIRTDLNGDTLWTKTIGGTNVDMGESVLQTSDGGFIITGYTTSFGAGNPDVYLIRLDKDTTGINEEIPSNFLNPNIFIVSYSNNNLISIHYTLQNSSY